MLNNTISIHICTKDNPASLAMLLHDIETLIAPPKRIFVYDDSVEIRDRQRNQAALQAMTCQVVYIDELRRQAISKQLTKSSTAARAYAKYAFKPFGKPVWDHAGIRAFAHLVAYATSAPGERILFLDDDISLMGDETYPVHTEGFTAVLEQPLAQHHLRGASYLGRADVYLVEHLWHAQDTNPKTDHLLSVPSYCGPERASELAGNITIGGGFLLLHREDLWQAPLAHCFNEDCIFISALLAQGYRTELTSYQPLHRPSVILPGIEKAAIEQNGFIVLQAASEALEQLGTADLTLTANYSLTLCAKYADRSIRLWRQLFALPIIYGTINANKNRLFHKSRVVQQAQQSLRSYFGAWHDWQATLDDPATSQAILNCLVASEAAPNSTADAQHSNNDIV
ncbi:MAG TPA: hypothetical protein VLF69_05220 [Candidatus Saccharimonadales bacterium]|nr:hypothetical protein [Candidatus Saccharimonadales bacterium]